MRNIKVLPIAFLVISLLAGCGANGNTTANAESITDAVADNQTTVETQESEVVEKQSNSEEETIDTDSTLPNLAIRFGETEDRPVYEIQLEDNEVSLQFVRILQKREQTIPIYVFDGSENTDVLQYYDIPSRYNIPNGSPVSVDRENAGDVYYSAPSRIMIFYRDAELPGNYVKVGTVTTVEGLEDAVNSNPLDAWENKRVMVSIAE